MGTLVVTGSTGAIGRRVVALLQRERSVLGLEGDSLRDGFGEPVDTVVHLAWPMSTPRGGDTAARANVETTRRVLEAAAAAGVRSIVHLSDAIVYGAWPDNPEPLTEEAPLRPNPGVVNAVYRAEAERLVATWAHDHPEATVAVLRPATILGPGVDTWLSRALGGQPFLRPNRANPPRQFVHVEDVASAIALATRACLDGAFNVAGDGAIAADVVRGLSAGRLSFPVPNRLAVAAAGWAWGLRVSNLPPALLPLIEYPWVIANDKLRAVGWEPRHTNEEAVVSGRPAGRWREMNPGRRQELALAGVGAAAAGTAAAVVAAVAAHRRRS